MSHGTGLNHIQLRRKGRNGYLASDVEAMIGLLKRELADARQREYDARLQLQRMAQSAPPSGPPAPSPPVPTVDLTDHQLDRQRLLSEVAALEQARNGLIHEITQSRLQLADLDEVLAQRRNQITGLAQELLHLLGPRPLPLPAEADLFA